MEKKSSFLSLGGRFNSKASLGLLVISIGMNSSFELVKFAFKGRVLV